MVFSISINWRCCFLLVKYYILVFMAFYLVCILYVLYGDFDTWHFICGCDHRHGFRIIVYVFIFRKNVSKFIFFLLSQTHWCLFLRFNHQFRIVIKLRNKQIFWKTFIFGVFEVRGINKFAANIYNDSKTECVLHSIPFIMDILATIEKCMHWIPIRHTVLSFGCKWTYVE